MGRKAVPDIEMSLGFASVGANFANIGTPTTHGWEKFWIINLTDKPVVFSWDNSGTNRNLTLPANSGFVDDVSTNNTSTMREPPVLPIGTQFQVKHNGSAPTSGNVYVNGEYIQGDV